MQGDGSLRIDGSTEEKGLQDCLASAVLLVARMTCRFEGNPDIRNNCSQMNNGHFTIESGKE